MSKNAWEGEWYNLICLEENVLRRRKVYLRMTSGYLLKDDFGVEGNYTAVKLCHCLVSASLIQEGFFFSVVHEKLN